VQGERRVVGVRIGHVDPIEDRGLVVIGRVRGHGLSFVGGVPKTCSGARRRFPAGRASSTNAQRWR